MLRGALRDPRRKRPSHDDRDDAGKAQRCHDGRNETRDTKDNTHYPSGALLSSLESRGWSELKLIGEGTSAQVFSACRRESSAPFALKVFKCEERYDMQATSEAIALKAAGDCCVRYWGLEEHAGHTVLVLERLTCTLRKVTIVAGDSLNPNARLLLALELLIALHTLHRRGYVHGDVKPENILWSAESECLKLIDLALAIPIHPEEDALPQPAHSPGCVACVTGCCLHVHIQALAPMPLAVLGLAWWH